MSRSTDLRVLKTRKLIRDSFIKLMDEKGFENITVNDISEKAQINRSTFYLHYTDKYELLDRTVEESIEKLLALSSPKIHIKERNIELNSLLKDIQEVMKIIAEDALFYKTMLGDNGIPHIRKKMEVILKQNLEEGIQEEMLTPRNLFFEVLLSIYMGTIIWWLNNGMIYSPDYMAQQLIKMLTMGPIKVAGLAFTEEES
jgi:AcrR family transcriptional regulator